jgi:hypothetical protein
MEAVLHELRLLDEALQKCLLLLLVLELFKIVGQLLHRHLRASPNALEHLRWQHPAEIRPETMISVVEGGCREKTNLAITALAHALSQDDLAVVHLLDQAVLR